MKSEFKGIIFDIDGTLTSTNQLIFDTFNFVATKYLNKTFTDREIIGMFGPTEEVILKLLFKNNYDAVVKDYYDYYRSHHEIANLYPGIKELLGEIKNSALYLSIYTGKGRLSSIITLTELGIINYFDMIVSGDDVDEHKPSPQGITMFLDKFNLKQKQVLMVGDSPADINAAKAAGVKIASVIWDSYSKHELKILNGNNIFHNVEELRNYIFKSY
jgi:HAD superfamily hydrolase (TIGR01549 family)